MKIRCIPNWQGNMLIWFERDEIYFDLVISPKEEIVREYCWGYSPITPWIDREYWDL